MKEDLSITRACVDKIQVCLSSQYEDSFVPLLAHCAAIWDYYYLPQAENRKLKGELEKLRLVEKKSDRDSSGTETQLEKKPSFVQVLNHTS